jgi:hypothetical protein
MNRAWTTAVACVAALAVANLAYAAKGGGGPNKKPGAQGGGAEHGKGHKHSNKNGHNLLGAKLKHDGKHAVGTLHNHTVTAEVKGGKVVGMAAGDMRVKRVRTKTKMAVIEEGGLIQAAWRSPYLQLAQYDDYYYGYCFEDEYDYDCYWYPASDVDYADYEWEDYDPYY